MRETFIPLSAITTRKDYPSSIRRPLPETTFDGNRHLEGRETGKQLIELGLMTGAGTVQGDIAVSTNSRTGEQQGLCDHNCGPEGGYSCPARRSINQGLNINGLAPAGELIQGFLTAAAGVQEFNQRFVANGSLDAYSSTFNIPSQIKEGIAYNLLNEKIMANIFGGNAEMHPDVIRIAKELKEAGLRTTVTTTGGILLNESKRGKEFLQGLRDGHVDVLAVSAEFDSAERIRELAAMDPAQLREAWRKTPYLIGQKRKGIEALNAARLQKEDPDTFPTVVLNLVIHPGILHKSEEIIETLKEIYPDTKINPYPAQSAFEDEPPLFSTADVPDLTTFLKNRLAEQRDEDPHMVLRPHYYAMLNAVRETHKDNPEKMAEMLSGYDVWKCYEAPYDINGAGSVFQFGASPKPLPVDQAPHAGGYADCFWNPTPTDSSRQIWEMTPTDVASHIDGGMEALSQTVEKPCAGCLMPRLNGDVHTLEAGLNPKLKPEYLAQRRNTVGF